jgi:glucose/arabinose dehydrogenase
MRLPSALITAALASLLAGCVAGGPSQPASTASTPPTSSPASSAPSPAEKPADLAHLRLGLTRRWGGFASPLHLTNAGDGSGRLFVVEQAGTVRVIRDGRVSPAPYIDIRRLVLSGGEQGLLGMAFAPRFEKNGHVYLDYTDLKGDTVIARYTASDPASDSPTWHAETILRIGQPYANHNGGCLQFGPDGDLWIGMGDGGSAGDPGNRAQNPRLLLGKILRIDAENPSAGKPYGIPPGQPVQKGWAPEVWSIGMRNPWRFSFDASSGALWIGDVGQNAWEEIDVVERPSPGLDFGWPLWEGTHPYRGMRRDRFVFPIYDYSHHVGESVTGGYVYRGKRYPALVGAYVFGDFVDSWVGAIRTTSPSGAKLARPESEIGLHLGAQPSSFGVDEQGELYVVDYAGAIWQVTGERR